MKTPQLSYSQRPSWSLKKSRRNIVESVTSKVNVVKWKRPALHQDGWWAFFQCAQSGMIWTSVTAFTPSYTEALNIRRCSEMDGTVGNVSHLPLCRKWALWSKSQTCSEFLVSFPSPRNLCLLFLSGSSVSLFVWSNPSWPPATNPL